MKKLYTLLFLVVCSLSFGQTIYTENMGTGSGTLAITATTFFIEIKGTSLHSLIKT